MKKVLIWDISFKLANTGGPAGYLYNLHEYLKNNPNSAITFLSDLYLSTDASEQHAPVKLSLKDKLLQIPIIKNINELISVLFKLYHSSNIKLPASLNWSEYDYIHVHHPADVTRHKKLLRKFSGKIICTCHCPCLLTDEIIANRGGLYKLLRPVMLRQELSAYNAADYLMFPCREAREPYEKDYRTAALFSQKEDKFFYCPSAIMDIPTDREKMQKVSSLGIPQDAFLITYFGRHNEVKGYDTLVQVGESLLEKYKNLYFLCAGKGPIHPPQHPRWIELGFIHNTNELLSQSDLYVLPNRETYFDLVVIEVLRAGIPIVMSNTGGNKFYTQFVKNKEGGIRLYEEQNRKMLIQIIENLIAHKSRNPNTYRKMGMENRALFLHYFVMRRYMEQYISVIQTI